VKWAVNLKRFTILLAALTISSAFPQSPGAASAPVAFEVASIKPSDPQSKRGSDGGPGSKDPTRYSFGLATLLDLISIVYHVDYFQVSSATALDRQDFDLVARAPQGATKQQFRVMLQNLLAERFELKAHLESREFNAHEMVVAKTGLKLKEAVPGEIPSPPDAPTSSGDIGWPQLPPNVSRIVAQHSLSGGYNLVRLKAQLEPLSELANFLPILDNVPVVDKTGLTGKYSFTLEYTMEIPGGNPDAPPAAPTVFTALRQQLGLHLASKKFPFDVVVVESFNKLPSENQARASPLISLRDMGVEEVRSRKQE
jgi:uncharacterized protein (TIGR03435 family)